MNREFAGFYAAAGGKDPQTTLAELEKIGNGGRRVTATYLSRGRRHDYSEAVRQVEAPVVVIHGEKDLQPESVSRRYANRLANAKVEVIPGAGHFAFDESPTEFAEIVRAFLGTMETG